MKAIKMRKTKSNKPFNFFVIFTFAMFEWFAWVISVKLDFSGGGWFVLALIAFTIVTMFTGACTHTARQTLEDEMLYAFEEGYNKGYEDGKAGEEKDKLILVD